MATLWHKLRVLGAADRRLLAETALLTLRICVDLRLLPFAALRERLDRIPGTAHAPHASPDRVAWAVAAVTRRLPGATCLAQSLVADVLLRRRGYLPQLHIGVRSAGRGTGVPLDAHAWVECEGRVVAGEVADLSEYGPLLPVRPPRPAAQEQS